MAPVNPEVLWAQRSSAMNPRLNVIYLTVNVPGISEPSTTYAITPRGMSFQARIGEVGPNEKNYSFVIEFYAEVVPAGCSITFSPRSLFIVLQKRDLNAAYWPRLQNDKRRLKFVKTDFSRWVDEEDQSDDVEHENTTPKAANQGVQSAQPLVPLPSRADDPAEPSDLARPSVVESAPAEPKKSLNSAEMSEMFSKGQYSPFIMEEFQRLADAVKGIPDTHPEKPGYLVQIGDLYTTRAQQFALSVDVEEAVSFHQAAVDLAKDNDPRKAAFLACLAASYKNRYHRFGHIADLDSAISSLDACLAMESHGRLDKPACLNNLANLYTRRFDRLGNAADIDNAIRQCQQSLLEATGKPSVITLNNLGNAFLKRFELSDDVEDLCKSVNTHEATLRLTSDFDPNQPTYQCDLGSAYFERSQRLGAGTDFQQAIDNIGAGASAMPHGHPERRERLADLAKAFLARFIQMGAVEDLESAISNLDDALRMTPDGHPFKIRLMSSLGLALSMRYERSENIVDFDKAVVLEERALNLTSFDHPSRATRASNLANTYSRRFGRTGDIADLDKAISTLREQTRLTLDPEKQQFAVLSNLGNLFSSRFEWLGDRKDADAAIHHQEAAVRLTPDDHPVKPSALHNLGCSLLSRFSGLGDIADIDKAISHLQAALLLLPDGHRDKGRFHNNLAIALTWRFQRQGACSADADGAIANHEAAVKFIPDHHPSKPQYQNNLGTALVYRFERFGDVADLDKAIPSHVAATHTVSDSNPLKPVFFDNLGRAYMLRFHKRDVYADLREGIHSYSKAATSVAGPPFPRYRAAQQWSTILHTRSACGISDSGLPPMLEGYATALSLMPRLAWHGLSVDARYRELLNANDLACDAAAAAITMDDPAKALEWLEQGRAIVWGQSLQLRTPLDEVREVNPVLAGSLSRVSLEMEKDGSDAGMSLKNESEAAVEQLALRHRRLADQWEDLVRQVRQMPGFERFLRPNELSQLKEAARGGPVVVVNVSKHRCDALIVTSSSQTDPLRHISLPNFTYGRARILHVTLRSILATLRLRDRGNGGCEPDMAAELIDSTTDESRHGVRKWPKDCSGDDTLRAMLAELWTSVVKPVLDCLGFKPIALLENLPRIWWCPTGPLSFLPLHAAGIYHPDGTNNSESLSDYAISSYTPTLSSLLVAWKPRASDSSQAFRMLAVAQPSTPGATPLPGTQLELKHIQRLAPRLSILTLEGNAATVTAVKHKMSEFPWVHLACHGVQELNNPTRSGLLLDDGRLELLAITKERLPNAEFAFLSACQTATGDENRPDEAIHLAAGMLLAGYRGVIATMWSIQDNDAPFVAEDVYTHLLRGGGLPDSQKAAWALHLAVKRLRERHNGRSFASWVPFIHVGL